MIARILERQASRQMTMLYNKNTEICQGKYRHSREIFKCFLPLLNIHWIQEINL